MKNRYGLDTGYIGKNLNLIQRHMENYLPSEMRRVLMRLASTCDPEGNCRACRSTNTILHGGDHNWCTDCKLPYSVHPNPTE